MARVNLHMLLIASFFLIQTVDFSMCSLKTFRCRSGEYISSSLFCDGANDCKDGSDEAAGCRKDASHENQTEKNPTNGVAKPVKELHTIPLMEDEKVDDGEVNDGEPEEPEIDEAEESYDAEVEAVEENRPIKKYVEPRETPSTSSTTTPRIPYLRGKPEDDEHNNNNNASQTKSNTSTIEPPLTAINTNHGLMRKNYCIVLFIPVLSYFFFM